MCAVLKKYFATIIKYFRPLYKIYYWCGSIIINTLKIFIKPKDNLILFICFGGKKFDDSPKAIYESMIKDSRFADYELVWAFENTNDFEIPRGNKIKTDSLIYYITALKARCWITNSTVERGLNFKGRNTLYFNTWHGTPLKKMGDDIVYSNKSFKMKSKWNVDIMTSQSSYEADILSRVFNIDRERFIVCGLPRNDALKDRSIKIKNEMMEKIGLPPDKKVILYAPTFREYERDEMFNCIIKPPIDFHRWKEEIGDQYIILLRAHYEVAKVLNIKADDEFVYNVSEYPVLNELMLASDLLISDYSSIFFDYSILDRPMFYYTYDYNEYADKRGMYFDIRRELNGSSDNEETLLNCIKKINFDMELGMVRKFRDKYVNSYGNATEASLDILFNKIKSN